MVPPSPHHFSGAGAATTTPHHAAGAWGNHKENAAPVGVTPGAKSYAATPSAKTNAESVAEVRPRRERRARARRGPTPARTHPALRHVGCFFSTPGCARQMRPLVGRPEIKIRRPGSTKPVHSLTTPSPSSRPSSAPTQKPARRAHEGAREEPFDARAPPRADARRGPARVGAPRLVRVGRVFHARPRRRLRAPAHPREPPDPERLPRRREGVPPQNPRRHERERERERARARRLDVVATPASAASAPRTTSHHRHEPASGGAPLRIKLASRRIPPRGCFTSTRARWARRRRTRGASASDGSRRCASARMTRGCGASFWRRRSSRSATRRRTRRRRCRGSRRGATACRCFASSSTRRGRCRR